VPYIPTVQFVIPTAYRKNLNGLIVAPVVFLWNVEKKSSVARGRLIVRRVSLRKQRNPGTPDSLRGR
jgi:hypothetical protein